MYVVLQYTVKNSIKHSRYRPWFKDPPLIFNMLSKKKEVEVLRRSASNSAFTILVQRQSKCCLIGRDCRKNIRCSIWVIFLDFSTWLKYSASLKVYLLLFSDYIQNMVSWFFLTKNDAGFEWRQWWILTKDEFRIS